MGCLESRLAEFIVEKRELRDETTVGKRENESRRSPAPADGAGRSATRALSGGGDAALTQVYDEPFNLELVLREWGRFAGSRSVPRSPNGSRHQGLREPAEKRRLIRPSDGGAPRGRRVLQSGRLPPQQVTAASGGPAPSPEVAQWGDSGPV